jgi:disulfide bond formation protein DsbB
MNHLFSFPKLLTLTSAGLLFAALVFQYAFDLAPCVQCVYQRFGLLVVVLGAILMSVGPLSKGFARIASGSIALSGAMYMTMQAWSHMSMQRLADKNPFAGSCAFSPTFPMELPLQDWLPFLFSANGPCGDIDWEFIGLSMPTWVFLWGCLFVFSLSVWWGQLFAETSKQSDSCSM